jgi:hypothetical protein
MALVTTAYVGNIHFYSKFFQYEEVWLEANENYQKQSYRNRFDIYSANGRLTLTAPVIYSNKPKTKIKDVELDYAMDWQKVHFKSIESAYRSSPFYEFFMDEFMFVFEQKEKYLYDLNKKIMAVIMDLLQLDHSRLRETAKFIKPSETGENVKDFRNLIHPKSKKNDPEFKPASYHQVFEEKHGFIENLSILDLLFNEGGNAGTFLNCSKW